MFADYFTSADWWEILATPCSIITKKCHQSRKDCVLRTGILSLAVGEARASKRVIDIVANKRLVDRQALECEQVRECARTLNVGIRPLCGDELRLRSPWVSDHDREQKQKLSCESSRKAGPRQASLQVHALSYVL